MNNLEYFDTYSAAKALDLSQPQVLRRIRSGQLVAEKLGRHEWFIHKNELVRYAEKKGRTIPRELLEVSGS